MNKEEEEAPLRTCASVEIVLLEKGTLLDLRSNVQQMLTGG